eukprot:SAG22_NODE_4983_length_1115_cov_8.806102_1_plen_244_part_10
MAGTATMAATEVGKRELPAWAAEVVGRDAVKLRELKDGSVLLRLLMEIFPACEECFEGHIQEPHPPNRIAVNHNWLCITTALDQLALPGFDRAGIAAVRPKATLSALAMLYFLYNISERPDFAAAFSFPLPDNLTTFLQSERCIAALAAGGAIRSDVHPLLPILFDEPLPAALADPESWRWKHGAGDPGLAKRRRFPGDGSSRSLGKIYGDPNATLLPAAPAPASTAAAAAARKPRGEQRGGPP